MSEKCINAMKKLIGALIDQPLLGSLFIADIAILSLVHTIPFIFALAMLVALVGMSMYYGQKLVLFQCDECKEESKPAQ